MKRRNVILQSTVTIASALCVGACAGLSNLHVSSSDTNDTKSGVAVQAMAKQSWIIVTPDKTQLRAERFGTPQQPAVILISGAGAPGAFWPDHFCQSIASLGYQVVRFDHRDTGASTHMDEQYPISTLVDDVHAVIEDLGVSETHLVGHSMGGYIVAMMLSGDLRTHIATGTAISAGPTSDLNRYAELEMSTVSDETWGALIGNEPQGQFEIDLQGWLSTWQFLNGDRDFDPNLAEAYTRELYTGDARNAQVAVNHVHAMTTVPSNLPERLASISAPFLVVHGSKDMLVPIDNGRALSRLANNSTFHALDGAGHMFFLDETWDEIGEVLVAHME